MVGAGRVREGSASLPVFVGLRLMPMNGIHLEKRVSMVCRLECIDPCAFLQVAGTTFFLKRFVFPSAGGMAMPPEEHYAGHSIQGL